MKISPFSSALDAANLQAITTDANAARLTNAQTGVMTQLTNLQKDKLGATLRTTQYKMIAEPGIHVACRSMHGFRIAPKRVRNDGLF